MKEGFRLMKNGYYAGIDVGTNAGRLVIKDVYQNQKGQIVSARIQEIRIPLRLGADVFSTGSISFRKEEQLIDTMRAFRSLMNIYGVIDYRAYATSAMREATNGSDIIWRIRKETGIDMQIVSGEKEAQTITSIISDIHCGEGVYLSVDVGGGSTEISLIKDGKPVESTSFAIGTLRILAKKDKFETWGKLKDLLNEYHDKYGELNIIGTGGNINRYWKMSEHETKKGVNILHTDELKALYNELSGMTVDERRQKYKLKPDRADVIVPAGKIYLTAAKIMGAKYFIVPLIGLGDGIVDELIENSRNVI